MKKLLTTVQIFILLATVTALLGCSSFVSSDTLMLEEFNRLRDLIPDTYSDDVFLPESSEDFTLIYQLNEEILEDNVLFYDIEEQDKSMVLELVIEYKDNIESYYVVIVQEGYQETEELTTFQEIFLEINHQFPFRITSNYSLPEIDDSNTNITYDVTCTDIERNRVIYTYPNEDTECNLIVDVEYLGETQSTLIPFVMSSVENLPRIPQIHISTISDDWIYSKETYTEATITVTGDSNPMFTRLENQPMNIKLRGNSTLYMPKKSFRIHFDEKVKFLSTYGEKDWVLLANFTDQSLIRNYLAYNLSRDMGMEFAPMARFVDVYVNGVYEGNYLLSDRIEVTNDRVDIDEHSLLKDTGYLVELDHTLYWRGFDSGDNYFMYGSLPFVIKSPQQDDPNYRDYHKTYIENYMTRVLETLEAKEDYKDLIDEASFVDWFIVNELFKNVDSGYSSVYYVKDKEGLLKMGPVWDFDLSSGNQGHADEYSRGPIGWYTSRQDKNLFYYHLVQYESFQNALKTRWNEIYDELIIELPNETLLAADSITHSQYQNFNRWDIIGKNNDWYTSPEILELSTYDEQVWFLYDYLITRMEWMDEEINAW